MLVGKDLKPEPSTDEPTPEESFRNTESDTKLPEEKRRGFGNLFWWSIALLPIIAIAVFLVIGFVGILLIQSIKNDGRLVIALGFLLPVWFLSIYLRITTTGDPKEDEAWKIALGLSVILWFIFLVPYLLYSIGWL